MPPWPPWILNQQLIFLSFAWEHVCSWIIWAKLLSLSCLKQGGYGGHMVHLQIGARASYHSKVILHLHTGSRYGPTFCSPASNNVRPTWHHFSLLCPYCTLSYITVRPLHFCYCFIKCMWGYSSSCVCNCDMSTSQFENIWSHGYRTLPKKRWHSSHLLWALTCIVGARNASTESECLCHLKAQHASANFFLMTSVKLKRTIRDLDVNPVKVLAHTSEANATLNHYHCLWHKHARAKVANLI